MRTSRTIFRLMICVGLATLILPIRAHAQFTGRASATTQFESNSNVFALDAGSAQPGTNDFRRSDTDYSYGAELDGSYKWSRQQLYAVASTTEYDYQHFTQLDHDDYKFDLGLNWALGRLWDGKLDATRTRNMVPFLDLSGESVLALSLATEQRETAQIGLRLSSDWKLEGVAFTSQTDEPIPGSPNLQLTQNSGSLSLQYLGIGHLTTGLTVNYLGANYDGSANGFDGSYRQSTIEYVADYKHNRMTFEGEVGYSRRSSDLVSNNESGFTGLIDFKEQLTPKTSFTVKLDRLINNYILTSSSEIDTDAGFGVNWQSTYKLGFSLDYTFTYRAYAAQPPSPPGTYRVDYQQYGTFGLQYLVTRWLLIKPYANVLTRRSNFAFHNFDADIFGVSITVQTGDRAK
jgi:hypothetical protein